MVRSMSSERKVDGSGHMWVRCMSVCSHGTHSRYMKAWRRFGQSTKTVRCMGKRYFRASVGCGLFVSSQNVRRIVETRHTQAVESRRVRRSTWTLNSCKKKDLEGSNEASDPF